MIKEPKYDFKLDVLEVIKRAGLINGQDLARHFNHKSTRQTRMAIQQLRKDGYPICLAENDNGYFYSTNKTDIDRTVSNLLKRADEIIQVCEGMTGGVK